MAWQMTDDDIIGIGSNDIDARLLTCDDRWPLVTVMTMTVERAGSIRGDCSGW